MAVMRALILAALAALALPAADFSVVSLNLAREQNVDRILAELRRSPDFASADVFLLQEVVQPAGVTQGPVHVLARRLGYRVEFESAFSPQPGLAEGLAILSRYPLSEREVLKLPRYNLRFRTRSRIGLAVTARTPLGRVRLVNTHLDSRLNVWEREAQLRPLAERAARFDGPIVLGGDLNTSNFRWFARAIPLPFLDNQRNGISSLMRTLGFVTPFDTAGPTHDRLGLRLDWIFLKDLDPDGATRIQPLRFSDHHAIWTGVKGRRMAERRMSDVGCRMLDACGGGAPDGGGARWRMIASGSEFAGGQRVPEADRRREPATDFEGLSLAAGVPRFSHVPPARPTGVQHPTSNI